MGLRSWCPRVLAFVLLAAGSSACGPETAEREVGADVSSMSPSDISPDGTVSVSGLTIKDYEKGSLPSYPYEGVDPRLWGYAYDLHVASCMVDRGRVAPPVQEFDWNAPEAETLSGGWGRPRTVDEARQYGYHAAPSELRDFVMAAEAFLASQGEAYHEDFEDCRRRVMEDPVFERAGQAMKYMPQASGFEENPALKEAMAAWRECMAPLGIPDLPEDRPGPAPSVMERFGLGGADNARYADLSTLTEEEVEIAVHEAQCTENSGYDRLAYGLTWEADDSYLADHAPEFAAVLEEIREQEQTLKDYINAHRSVVD